VGRLWLEECWPVNVINYGASSCTSILHSCTSIGQTKRLFYPIFFLPSSPAAHIPQNNIQSLPLLILSTYTHFPSPSSSHLFNVAAALFLCCEWRKIDHEERIEVCQRWKPWKSADQFLESKKAMAPATPATSPVKGTAAPLTVEGEIWPWHVLSGT